MCYYLTGIHVIDLDLLRVWSVNQHQTMLNHCPAQRLTIERSLCGLILTVGCNINTIWALHYIEITCHKVISTTRSIVLVSLVYIKNLPQYSQVEALATFLPVVQ